MTARLAQIEQAIKTVKRLGGKPPSVLIRYRRVLVLLASWQRKRKMAETKVKKYARIVRRYDKKVGGIE